MKTNEGNDLVRRATEALRGCLSDVPFCHLEADLFQASSADRSIDLTGRFVLSGRSVPFMLEAKGIGQPRFIRESLYNLLRYRSSHPASYGIFAAPFLAEEAAKMLEAEGFGYVDFSGNCRLCFDDVYVLRTGNENRFARRRDLRLLFSPKSERVLRLLLLEPSRCWKVQDLAKEARISLGQASNVKRKLEDREWVTRAQVGIRLAKPDRLLSEWKETYDVARSQRRDYFTLDNMDEFEQRLAKLMSRLDAQYALTAFSAAARYAPAVRYQRVYAYISREVEKIAEELELKAVESGANVTLIQPYDEGVFMGAGEKDGVSIVSPVQAYLDLSQLRGRGEESAEVLLREVIKPSWR